MVTVSAATQPNSPTPVLTFALGETRPSSLAFGDGITAGTALPDPSLAYPAHIASALGLALTNAGIANTVACDVLPLEILNVGIGPSEANAPLTSLMTGTGDADTWATTTRPRQ